MPSIDTSLATEKLVAARHGRFQIQPPFPLPDRAAVHAIQDAVARATGPVDGWKVAVRVPDFKPEAAPLLAGSVVAAPARFDGAAMHMIGVEVEIAFRIARDLPPGRGPIASEDALAAIGEACVALEVVDTRIMDFIDAPSAWLLADNQMNHALVTGTPIGNWRDFDWPSLAVRLAVDGRTVILQRGGYGPVDPTQPLAWMIDHVVRERGGLCQGAVITTGSWTGLLYVPPGAAVRGEFIGLGTVEASF